MENDPAPDGDTSLSSSTSWCQTWPPDGHDHVYSCLVFAYGVEYLNCPMPHLGWPLLFEEMTNINRAADLDQSVIEYFLELNNSKFAFMVKTAQLFEKKGIVVNCVDEPVRTMWYDIVTLWLQYFCKQSQPEMTTNAIRAKFNRVFAKFKKLQARYNARKQDKVQEEIYSWCAEKVVLPRGGVRAPVTPECIAADIPCAAPSSGLLTLRSGNEIDPVVLSLGKSCGRLKAVNNELKRKLVNQSACERNIKEDLNSKLIFISKQTEELKTLQPLVGIRNRELRQENMELNEKLVEMKKKVKGLKDLQLKTKSQEKSIVSLRKNVKQLETSAASSMEIANDLEDQVESLKMKVSVKSKKVYSSSKKLKRRESTIVQLRNDIDSMRITYRTDQTAFEAYHEGIVNSLQQRHGECLKDLQHELDGLKSLETVQNGKFRAEVRLMYYDLLTKGVSSNIVQGVVRSVLEHSGHSEAATVRLPSRSTAQRMVAEAGYLAKIRATYELAKQRDKQVGHQSDGTTKQLIHWGAHALRLTDEKDPSKSNLFTLTVSPVASGRSDDTVEQLQAQFDEMEKIADEMDLDYDYNTYSVDRIGSRMSDRAANEKKVTKLLIQKKRAFLEGHEEWENLTEAEKLDHIRIYSFTCAAHKVNNMASAMTAASSKEIHPAESTPSTRGMKGATKQVYEVNKLLCEQSRKEYSLGADFKAYNMSSETESGASLFKPIVGSRYLIFLHNAIPSLSAKDIVMLYLEDVKDGKDKAGLNRLEQSVQKGYLDITVESEMVAYALMYYHVCSKLLAKGKSVKSPLDMNPYYQDAIDALGLWAADPTSLMDGTQEMWPGSNDVEDALTADMMNRVRGMGDPDLVKKILKVMAQAGMEKLADHAEEHLPGGLYHTPSEKMEDAGRTIGEATNDRIESMFGQLDRRVTFAPMSNPINVGHLIAAKTDKVVQWTKENVRDKERVCSIARQFAAKERKREGSRSVQQKRLYEIKKARKDPIIAKRRQQRIERERIHGERRRRMQANIVRDIGSVDRLTGIQLNEQYHFWRLIAASTEIKNSDVMTKFIGSRVADRRLAIKKLIESNAGVTIDTDGEVCVDDIGNDVSMTPSMTDSDWSTSDEETLDTLLN